MRLRSAIPAGLVDTASAALATFVVQVAMIRYAEAEVLGIYALFFSAFMVAYFTTLLLLLRPAEIVAARLPVAVRLPLLSRSLEISLAAPAIALVSVLVPVALAWSLGPPRVVLGFAVTYLLVASLAPIQEHLKAMLHTAARSWDAAVVSLVTVPVSVGATALLLAFDVADWLLPFGALAVVHASALSVGLYFTRRDRAVAPVRRLSLRELMRTGRWLLVGGLAPFVGTFISAALVARLADPAALGLAEAARVASRPLLVVGGGIAAVLAPRIMTAAAGDDRRLLRQYGWLSVAVFTASAGLLWLTIGFDWPWNVVAVIVPKAYEVGGLVALFLVAHLLLVVGWVWRFELLGYQRERRAAVVDVIGTAGMLVVSVAAAPTLGSWTVPLASLTFAIVLLIGYRVALGIDAQAAGSLEASGPSSRPATVTEQVARS